MGRRTKHRQHAEEAAPPDTDPKWVALALVACVAALVWAFWPALVEMYTRWVMDPEYSHGYGVPILAVAILACRYKQAAKLQFRPSVLGLLLLIAGLAVYCAAEAVYFQWAEHVAIVPCLLGLVWFFLGAPGLRWAAPGILVLLFMVPLPYFVGAPLQGFLRWLSTYGSNYLLQSFGFDSVAEGNVIVVGGVRMGIAEACSGIRMMMVFFALASFVAAVFKMTLPERLLVLASAIPISVVCNVLRITSTGVLYGLGYHKTAEFFFHDLAGWLMIPLAFVLLMLVRFYFSKLIVRESVEPMQMV